MSLTRKQVKRAQELSNALFECGDDVAFWCEHLGYEVFERRFKAGIVAVLRNGFIFIKKGLSHDEQIITIAHEIFHHEFHACTTAHRELVPKRLDLEECQAESFAAVVAEPSMLKYDTIREFYFKSALPAYLKKFREELYYRIKQ